MTNEEVKADLKHMIKDKKEMVESRIEFLVDKARLFIAHVQEAKDDEWKKLDEVNDLLTTFRMHYEVIGACNMQKSAYEVALGLLED